MKKLLSLLLVVGLLAGVSVPHIHDDKCGYNPKTQEGCVYEVTVDPLLDQDTKPNA